MNESQTLEQLDKAIRELNTLVAHSMVGDHLQIAAALKATRQVRMNFHHRNRKALKQQAA